MIGVAGRTGLESCVEDIALTREEAAGLLVEACRESSGRAPFLGRAKVSNLGEGADQQLKTVGRQPGHSEPIVEGLALVISK